MTYVVTENCINCKFSDCVVVCPVDCFYQGENMLVINPEECIDCGICVPECPVGAIEPGSDKNSWWIELNRKYSKTWPVLNKKIPAMENAEKMDGVKGKYEKYFSEKPGND